MTEIYNAALEAFSQMPPANMILVGVVAVVGIIVSVVAGKKK